VWIAAAVVALGSVAAFAIGFRRSPQIVAVPEPA
jgi:hypothetical protein